ncbi:hypothetical protein [Laspinema olomoucense]|uniref:Uncharacterized protein n=1 Tax=Laspinema olomoucense D3b TaxID=2953688 RepID=A0ABT2NEB0_9CYAN|nr:MULTISPECIES: hypothetical protein [unclassified Laspinema]MCT7974288.1 hypothetical protein [Laspinema sp. D3d]MCT7981034.1 hypothetical protein [Laspinema sp. D3b]MCT7991604.1 hypothetical protein [Laspinema sp. D3a]
MRLTQLDYTTFSLGLGKLGTNLGGLEFNSWWWAVVCLHRVLEWRSPVGVGLNLGDSLHCPDKPFARGDRR